MNFKIISISILLLLLFSCKKESSYPYKFAGVWQIDEVKIENYSEQGTKLDSSKTMSSPGIMLLDNITDNDFANDQQLAQLLFTSAEAVPPSIMDFCIKTAITEPENFVVNFVAGPHGTERLTFWKELSSLHELVIFTVPKLTRKKMELSYFVTDSEGYLIRSEHWICSIKE